MLGEQSHEKFPVKSPAIFQDGHVRDSIYTAASCDLYSQIPNRCVSLVITCLAVSSLLSDKLLSIHILEAARLGLVPRVTRRLTGHERSMIRPGTVWVWEEGKFGLFSTMQFP